PQHSASFPLNPPSVPTTARMAWPPAEWQAMKSLPMPTVSPELRRPAKAARTWLRNLSPQLPFRSLTLKVLLSPAPPSPKYGPTRTTFFPDDEAWPRTADLSVESNASIPPT